ncbi:MAG: inositol monophosphatase [Alphaproteobacteria bacterium]|nr:inositol monophosphatase [Alphaproteobacteria bacterium]
MMQRTAYSSNITVMKSAVQKVAKGLIRDFGEIENLQVSRKGPADFVTNADLRAEKLLHKLLAEARPSYGFLMEEGGEISSDEGRYRWIVDPLDGTNNFLHGFPMFAIAIALEETLSSGKKQILASIIHSPILQETFWAEKGKGAFAEDSYQRERRLRVSGRRELGDTLLNIGSITPDIIGDLMPKIAGIRCLGSTCMAMAYVAAGRLDGIIQLRGSKPWDIAAGKLLIEEAGGIVTNSNGGDDYIESASLISANPIIHPQLLDAIKQK